MLVILATILVNPAGTPFVRTARHVKQVGIRPAPPMPSLDGGVPAAPPARRSPHILIRLCSANRGCLPTAKWFGPTGMVAGRLLCFALFLSVERSWLLVALPRPPLPRFGLVDCSRGALIGPCNCVGGMLPPQALCIFVASVVCTVVVAIGLAPASIFDTIAWRSIPSHLGIAAVCTAALAVAVVNS